MVAGTFPAKVPSTLSEENGRWERRIHAAFDAFSPSQRREYVEWVTEEKTDATRQKRMATAIDWLSEGKSRNWKYEPK